MDDKRYNLGNMVDQITYHINLTLVNMKYGGSVYIPYKFNIGKHEICGLVYIPYKFKIGKHEIWWIRLHTI